MKIFNFSAGPACLPDVVLKAASKASLNYNNSGISLMEMSHRSVEVMNLFDEATKRVKELLNLPGNYHPLWLQGGASSQFSMVPLNLLPMNGVADYVETGSWSTKAIKECKLVGDVNISGTSKETNFNHIPKQLSQNQNSSYLHITSNNTIYGTQFQNFPIPHRSESYLVADMSSDIFSRKFDVTKFGLIYAGAQKNMGPAGVTLVIIRDDLVGLNHRKLHIMSNYESHVEKKSMFNTPPVFSVFVVNETLKWLEKNGGVEEIEKVNIKKAQKLYHEIDSNDHFYCPVEKEDRSYMNVPFVFSNSRNNDADFLIFCEKRGLKTLKGHRSVGGFRASIYNAMPESGVDTLIDTIKEYSKKI